MNLFIPKNGPDNPMSYMSLLKDNERVREIVASYLEQSSELSADFHTAMLQEQLALHRKMKEESK